MSLRFLCEELYWSKRIFLPLNDLIKATLENKNVLNQLDALITLSVGLIRKEPVDTESPHILNMFVSLLEEFITNLNEVHSSSEKVLLDFDIKISPLIYKYGELLFCLSRLSDSLKEHELKLVRFLNNLSIHSTLCITPYLRTSAFVERMFPKDTSDIPDIQISEQNQNVGENVPPKAEGLKANEGNGEPSVIPETPIKSSHPTCVGVASIRGIIPISSGSLFPLTPVTESSDVSLSVEPQVENLASFPTPSRTPPLIEFQKRLRARFSTPFVTPTEKKKRRDVIRTLRSNRRPNSSPWNVIERQITSPASSFNLRKRLFNDNDSHPNSANSSSSHLALYLSPDTEKDTRNYVSPDYPSTSLCKKSHGKSSTSENDKSKSPVLERNEGSYTELKKSIEGNLMGCEASLSDVELMDEIESSINMDNDVIFIDSTSKSDNHPRIESILPESASLLFQDAYLGQSSEALDNFTIKKTLSRSSQEERRRSSRLAGIPLPLKFSTEPLPDCRSFKKITLKQLSSKVKDTEVVSSSKKKMYAECVDGVAIQPLQRETTSENSTIPPQPVDLPQLASWQQIRLQIPTCWVGLIENHIKENHPDEMLQFQEPSSGSRWPTVYCNCAEGKRN